MPFTSPTKEKEPPKLVLPEQPPCKFAYSILHTQYNQVVGDVALSIGAEKTTLTLNFIVPPKKLKKAIKLDLRNDLRYGYRFRDNSSATNLNTKQLLALVGCLQNYIREAKHRHYKYEARVLINHEAKLPYGTDYEVLAPIYKSFESWLPKQNTKHTAETQANRNNTYVLKLITRVVSSFAYYIPEHYKKFEKISHIAKVEEESQTIAGYIQAEIDNAERMKLHNMNWAPLTAAVPKRPPTAAEHYHDHASGAKDFFPQLKEDVEELNSVKRTHRENLKTLTADLIKFDMLSFSNAYSENDIQREIATHAYEKNQLELRQGGFQFEIARLEGVLHNMRVQQQHAGNALQNVVEKLAAKELQLRQKREADNYVKMHITSADMIWLRDYSRSKSVEDIRANEEGIRTAEARQSELLRNLEEHIRVKKLSEETEWNRRPDEIKALMNE